jgi:methylmalonyl-CoA mutase N-terminal domain/subunit
LRTQQVIAYETGVANVADPLGGSWFVEALTDEIERRAESVFAHLDDAGGGSMLEGVIGAVEDGWFQAEIADAAYDFEKRVNRGRRVIVGVNGFFEGNDAAEPSLLRITAEDERRQCERLAAVRASRDQRSVDGALADLRALAEDPAVNLMPALIDTVRTRATLGEIMRALGDVFGHHVEVPRI